MPTFNLEDTFSRLLEDVAKRQFSMRNVGVVNEDVLRVSRVQCCGDCGEKIEGESHTCKEQVAANKRRK